MGFGGVKAEKGWVTVNPRLHKKWKGLAFNINYKGELFGLRIGKNKVTITASRSNKSRRTFKVWGSRVACGPGRTVVGRYGSH
jgi:trehalose/maltose hydrolase-like predicted phosphorylase